MSEATAAKIQAIVDAATTAQAEYAKFAEKHVGAAAPRARKALGEIAKASKEVRLLISEEVNAIKAAKNA